MPTEDEPQRGRAESRRTVIYTRFWAGCWGLVVVAGIAWATVSISVPGAVASLWCGGVLSASVAVLAVQRAIESGRRPATHRVGSHLRRVALVAFYGSAAGLAFVAICVAAPWLALFLLVTAVISSPPVLARLLARCGAPGASAASLDHERISQPPRTRSALQDMDDATLCKVFRTSFFELRDSSAVDERLAIAEFRRLCLDEFHRRNPAALHAWLESGGRASGSPDSFLREA